MKNLKVQIRNKRFMNRLAALLCVSLLLIGCGKNHEKREDMTAETQSGTYAEQVLEVGILANCADPYAVVTYESFVQAAGQSAYPVVVELHDCRDGVEALLDGLAAVSKTGIDVLLFDASGADLSAENKEELEHLIERLEVPVFCFGPRNPLNEMEIDGRYIGLAEQDAEAYTAAVLESQFDAAGYREHAWNAGKMLFEDVLSICVRK